MSSYKEEQNILLQKLLEDTWIKMKNKIINIFTGQEEYFCCNKGYVKNLKKDNFDLNIFKKNLDDLLSYYQDIHLLKYSFSSDSNINETILTKLLEYSNNYYILECTIPNTFFLEENYDKVLTLLSAIKGNNTEIILKILVIKDIKLPEEILENFNICPIEYLTVEKINTDKDARFLIDIFDHWDNDKIITAVKKHQNLINNSCEKKHIITIYLPTLSLYLCENLREPQYEYGKIRFKNGELYTLENNVSFALWAWRGNEKLHNLKCDRCNLNNMCSLPCAANAFRMYNDPTFPDDLTCNIQKAIFKKEG